MFPVKYLSLVFYLFSGRDENHPERYVRWRISAGLTTMSFGQITGKVTLTGKMPEMPEIAVLKVLPIVPSSTRIQVYDDKVVAGEKGELANVVIYIKSADGEPSVSRQPRRACWIR